MCGSPNIEPKPFELLMPFPKPLELPLPLPFSTVVCLVVVVEAVVTTGRMGVKSRSSINMDVVVAVCTNVGGASVVDGAGVGVVGIGGAGVWCVVGVGVIEAIVVVPVFIKSKNPDCASSAVLLMLDAKSGGTVPPALIIAFSAADKTAASSKVSFVVLGGITEFQSIVLN